MSRTPEVVLLDVRSEIDYVPWSDGTDWELNPSFVAQTRTAAHAAEQACGGRHGPAVTSLVIRSDGQWAIIHHNEERDGMEMTRRRVLGVVASGGLGMTLASGVRAAESAGLSLMPEGARTLKELMAQLDHAPRRRDFKEVPMVLTERDQWDAEAFDALLHYKGKMKQVWDHTAIDGPWLNLMRNSLNCQIWSFHHPDFLVVSGTHGPAHLALYDAFIWNKYQIAKLTKDNYKENVFLAIPAAAHADPLAVQDESGAYSPADNNSIPVLQARGVVFLACHNAIFEVCHKLHKADVNPDKLTVPQMVAEFTNHLIPDVVLTPGIVGTLPEMGVHGFQYIR